MRTRIALFAVLVLTLSSCGAGVPDEANAALSRAAAALQAKDRKTIADIVVAEQRQGALGLAGDFGITQADKKIGDFTLDDVLSVEFFTDVKAVKANDDLKSMADENTARLGVTFEYADNFSAVRSLVLKKTKDGWQLDMKATLDWWHQMNGAKALAAIVQK